MSNSQRFSSKSVVLRVFTFLLILSLMGLLPPAQPAFSAPDATYTVNNSGDLPDDDLDDGECDTIDAAPGEQCTLRAAIQQANVPNSGHDTILFSGFRVIAPSSELPALSHSSGTTIYSDDQVILSGINVSAGDGLTLASNGNKVMGLVIFLFDNGIMVTGNDNIIGTDGDGVNDAIEKNVIQNNAAGYGIALAGNNNVVAGNHIGVDIAGTSAAANTTGVFVSGNNNRIGTDGDGISDALERNIISGNTQFGLDISGDDTVVAGNYIGINSAGTAAIANGSHGVDIDVLALGTRVGTNSDGSGDTAQRNFISGNGGNGITTKGDDVIIAGNYIGTNAAGTSAIPNSGYGVAVGNFSYQTVVGTNGDGTRDSIEGNLISGNTSGGVKVSGDSRQVTVIAGNLIGTNPAGTVALGNGGDGIYAEGLGDDLVIGTNGDGFGDVNERNIISGNGQDGVHLSMGLSNAEIAGNYIGTNVMGNSAIGNAANGVLLDGGANHNLIGTDRDNSADTLERNVISGNAQSGVRIEGHGSDTNFIRGNYIGTNASGNSALANQIGVRVDDQAYLTVIGDEYLGAFGNVISGNTNDGIFIGSNCEATEIWKNVIGLNYLSMAAVSNGRNGIYLTAGAFDSLIQFNTIAENSGAGIFMTSSAGVDNYYYGNRIYSNAGLGVDLDPIGVNFNDPGDIDSGPNDRMNYPVFTHLVTDGESTLIEGQIDSEPDTTLEITAYAVESCDPTGYGEGGGEGSQFNYLGNAITTDSNGIGIIAMSTGDYSAARPYMVMSTGYSEFSECRLIASGQNTGLAQLNITDTSQNEGDSGSTWMDFDINLDRTASITVTVSYGMSNGSAQAGQDYIQSSGKISFPPGTTHQTIQVEILGDTDIESHETFRVSLYAAVGAQIEDSQATGTILNDDGGGGYYLFLPLIIR